MGISKRKCIYQYSLDGIFIKKWESLTEASNILGINDCNIPTAAKRDGTSDGFIWSYKFQGQQIIPKMKWQSPIKYHNIKQIDPKSQNIIAIFKNAIPKQFILYDLV